MATKPYSNVDCLMKALMKLTPEQRDLFFSEAYAIIEPYNALGERLEDLEEWEPEEEGSV
jgi:hypothetical protein